MVNAARVLFAAFPPHSNPLPQGRGDRTACAMHPELSPAAPGILQPNIITADI